MSTIDKYFPEMPWLHKVDDHPRFIEAITKGLNDNFGDAWGGFEEKYVEASAADRLIYRYIPMPNIRAQLAFHMRIFDKDFNGNKCFGVGGVFKTDIGSSEHVNAVFHALRRYCAKDVCIGFGMAPESLSEHYVKNILGGHYVDYNDTHKIYYVEFNDYKATDEDIKAMQGFELF